jgi:hypothetical protein
MGYMHRNHEKIGERNTWIMNFPYTDRLDYLTSMGNNFGYAVAVEQLTGVQIPERAEYIRVIMAELTRVLSHCWAIGFLLNDLGAFFTPALYAIEERELILDLFEMTSGSRMMCNYFRFGGVAADLPPEFLPMATALVNERLPKSIDQLDRFLMRISLGYPAPDDEARIIRQQPARTTLAALQPVLSAEEVLALQEQVDAVDLPRALIYYTIALADATRKRRLTEEAETETE